MNETHIKKHVKHAEKIQNYYQKMKILELTKRNIPNSNYTSLKTTTLEMICE